MKKPKNIPTKTLFAFAAAAFAFFAVASAASAEPAKAKPQSARSLAHLHGVLAAEPPLNQNDIDRYIKELPLILSLKDDPGGIHDVLAATGWTENRLVYVATKVGMGLKLTLETEEEMARGYPAFARPTAGEGQLILEREAELRAAFAKLVPAPPPARDAPKKKVANVRNKRGS
ncbi:MAG: hypothetical protein LBF41_01460 [Deltaproteobacteria bacterium]|nr:hypothetical protein [Deltaproteobacteria bacterium]